MVQNVTAEPLIDQCAQGDQQAQMVVYNQYAKMVFNSAYRILSSKMEAEDIMQETFIEAFSKLSELREQERFAGWLKRIAVNKSINALKKRRFVNFEMGAEPVAENEDIDIDNVKLERVYACIARLPEGYRVIISLYLLEGYDHEEIADILNIQASTSRSQYTRARKKLKHLYEESYGG